MTSLAPAGDRRGPRADVSRLQDSPRGAAQAAAGAGALDGLRRGLHQSLLPAATGEPPTTHQSTIYRQI